MEYAAVFLVSVAAFALMGWVLHFSRYKRRKGGCCGMSPHPVLSPGGEGKKGRAGAHAPLPGDENAEDTLSP
ncbi:hypothetical protein N9903_00675 [bacterium]|nr:hypothetical protein [bacterium]